MVGRDYRVLARKNGVGQKDPIYEWESSSQHFPHAIVGIPDNMLAPAR